MVTRHFILQWAFNKNTRFFLLLATFFFSVQTWAATANDNATADSYIRSQLQQCASLPDHERLTCYDRLATSSGTDTAEAPSAPEAIVNQTTNQWDLALPAPAQPTAETTVALNTPEKSAEEETLIKPSLMERKWELREDTQRSLFSLQPYGTSYMLLGQYGDRVNRQPSSPSPGHQSTTATDYRHLEAKFQLSVRSKIGRNLITANDSLWFGYTQVSQWQIWSPGISRPFRATSYKPEVLYVIPIQYKLPGTWSLRMAGLGLIHESNGQSDPLSRSWNRVYLGVGLDSETMSVYSRFWARVPESSSKDDNPDITHYMGRADVRFEWSPVHDHTLGFTLVSNLRHDNKGSIQLDYFFPLSSLWGLGDNLRGYIQVFHGYGETITDYNFRRTAIGFGLALKEW